MVGDGNGSSSDDSQYSTTSHRSKRSKILLTREAKLIYDANKARTEKAVSELYVQSQAQASPIVGMEPKRIKKLVDSRLNGQLALLLGSAAPFDKTLDPDPTNPALSKAPTRGVAASRCCVTAASALR